jgi:ABC-2 type transport system permease protein
MAPEVGRSGVIFATFFGIATTFITVMVFVIFFYLLDALYSERKERHILFWKSLPISDTETVVSKVLTASFVIPVCFFIGIFITKIVFLILSTLFIWYGGGSAIDLLWKPAPIFADFGISVYYIIAAALWMLPFTGWLLLSSSLAKKGRPFMWAILTPIFITMLEQILFGTTRFVETIAEYAGRFFEAAFKGDGAHFDININGPEDLAQLDPAAFELGNLIDPVGLLSSPSLWTGMLIGAVFIAAAIYIRRYRDDS